MIGKYTREMLKQIDDLCNKKALRLEEYSHMSMEINPCSKYGILVI
jgi:hypothetical protein